MERALGVTIRELGRHAAAVLDEVERSGRHIVISRHGRAVAFIGPIPGEYIPTEFDRLHVAPQYQGMAPLEDLPELEEEELVLLGDIGLVESRPGGGWKVTEAGSGVLRAD